MLLAVCDAAKALRPRVTNHDGWPELEPFEKSLDAADAEVDDG